MRNTFKLIFSVLLMSIAGMANAESLQERKKVLTTLAPIYSIVKELTIGTTIDVQNIPAIARRMSAQQNYLNSRADKLHPIFNAASAVVSIEKLWHQDPLYTSARQANIHIVAIDASKPWSNKLEGVTLIQQPSDDTPWIDKPSSGRDSSISPFFWLSSSNVIRSADIIARDLQRVAPEFAAEIRTNNVNFGKKILALKSDYENKFSQLDDVTVFALASELVYMTSELGLFIDGYFLKQDIHWSDQDLSSFTDYLQKNEITTVIHKWRPDEKIVAAIARANAKLVILDTGEKGIKVNKKMAAEGLYTVLSENYQKLFEAMYSQH